MKTCGNKEVLNSTLKQILDWNIENVIPGHGPLGGKDELEKEIMYLEDLRSEVATDIQKGMTLEEASKSVKMEAYKDFRRTDLLPLVIEDVYRELVDEQKHGEINNFNACHSMVIQSTYLNERNITNSSVEILPLKRAYRSNRFWVLEARYSGRGKGRNPLKCFNS